MDSGVPHGAENPPGQGWICPCGGKNFVMKGAGKLMEPMPH